MTNGVPSTAIAPNKLSCQLQTEVLDRLVSRVGVEVLIHNEADGNRHVEKEVVNVFIKHPTLGAAAVVASQLITVINCTHPLLVHYHTLRAGNRESGDMLLPSQHSACS